MDGEGLPAAAPVPTTAIPTTEHRAYGGKRFRKTGGRGPGAVVSVTMEKVVTGLDANGAEAGEAPDNNDELFDNALADARAARPKAARRR